MRLKTIEIKGFKSFANETVIHFDGDVIGIVGPNGSGKSNIVDAVRWVLGEQKTRELRLDQMSSVIFNGTKKRRPGGMAQVTLTFDNTKNILPTEYQTVSITRILYRSGESEYRLNGVTCRLKDITNLLMDTGIGSNSYAIIALSMVDDILADKDNARQRMFEQAAGISKYKVRKRETINKLNQTTADLDRVEDLLYEIEGNLKTLEKQARRTRRYFELKEQYKTLSLELAAWRTAGLKRKFKSLAGSVQEQEDAFRQIEIEIRQAEAALEAERKANLDKEQLLSTRQRELNSLTGRIRGMEADKRMLQQQARFAEETREKTARQIEEAKGQLARLEEQVASLRERLVEEKRLEAELEEQLDAAEAALKATRDKHGTLKADLDAVLKQQQELERRLFEKEKQKAVWQNQLQSLEQEAQRLAEAEEKSKGEAARLQEQLASLKAEEAQVRAQLEQLEKAEADRQKAIEDTRRKMEALEEERSGINRQLDARRNELQLMRSMVENLEGFPESIRFLSSKKEWAGKAHLLTDLIYVEENYRVAIENYLDPWLNYYVVPNLEAAHEAIRLLHSAQKGKAHFFLLDAFDDYEPPMRMLPAGTRPALDLVQCDPAYRKLVAFLLDGVVVASEGALDIRIDDPSLVLLAADGSFIRRRHSISGGSIGLFEGKKIGRQKNIEMLEKAIRKLQQQEQELSSEYFALKKHLETLRQKDLQQEIRQLQARLNRLVNERATAAARLEQFEASLSGNNARLEEIATRRAELEGGMQQLEGELRALERQLRELRHQISRADESYRSVAESLSEASARFNQANIEFIKQQNKVGALQKELAFAERQIDEIRARLQRDQKALEEAIAQHDETMAEIEKLDEQLLAAYAKRDEQQALLTEAEKAYFEARGGINELEDRLRKLNRKRQDLQSLINDLKDKRTEVQLQLQTVNERLRVEFNVSVNELPDPPDEADPARLAELEAKVSKLKNRLDNYGEINPMAVEAYEEMQERYETIKNQRDDILKAKEDLMETIKEIEDTATRQFLEAFEQVRLHFIEVFRSLFSEGDTADLILLNPDDPLNSKIEIVAKPKGKRPQTISQLSGGEKTLTATALLFALYLLKPAPFCIFDEVDAPLDDVNIEKFNRIIKKFSKESQFIIVTHNKLTMAAVDIIYGVYMPEEGVSAVTPVDFRQLEAGPVLEAVSPEE